MKIADLDANFRSFDVVLLQTPSSKMFQYMQDKVKRKYGIVKDNIITIETKDDFKKVRAVTGVVPLGSSRWFVEVNLDRHGSNKDLIKLITQSSTCVFFCTSTKYKYYKSFMELIRKERGISIADFYLTFLRKSDFVYLYDAFVPSDKRLAPALFERFMKGYAGDIDAVFELFLHLAKGEKFESMTAISDVCGFGGLTVETFIFSLLKPLSGSVRGLDTVIHNRLGVGRDLAESMGYASLYGRLCKSIQLMCDLKMLIMSGVVNRSVINIPKVFEDEGVSRYQRHIWRLKEISMSELLILRQCIGSKKWYSDIDLLNFIYTYYSMKAVQVYEKGAV